LTNVLRHAGRTASASVRVARSGEELSVCVLDTGAGGPVPAGDSTGIDGMRLRAESLGGSLTAGPGPDGGFMVRASLPIERSSTVDGRAG
jgi:signal transduction histidine kinase